MAPPYVAVNELLPEVCRYLYRSIFPFYGMDYGSWSCARGVIRTDIRAKVLLFAHNYGMRIVGLSSLILYLLWPSVL